MTSGYKNEFDFIHYLNNKKFGEINILMQEVIQSLFPKIKNNDIIKAYKYGRYAKADIVVSVNGEKHGISLKSGYHNSVHLESIKRFVEYLSNLGVNNKLIDSFLLYIYSDGTTDNTGINRLSNSEYVDKYSLEIEKLNVLFDQFRKEFINRFLIDTYVNYKVKADIFIHGTLYDFIWVTSKEVESYLSSVEYNSKSVHSSKLFIQNWNKNICRNNKYEHCREYIQIKWFSMYDDMIYMMANRNQCL